MTLNSHFASNAIFRVESFSVDALDLRRDCFKMDGDAHILSAAKTYSPQSVVSGDIRLMPILAGIRWIWGIK